MLLAYEATNDLVLADATVETPRANRRQARAERSLRSCRSCEPASGWSKALPFGRARGSGHIGLYRDHDTLEPVDYYFKVPGDAPERDFFLLDPMPRPAEARVAASSLKRASHADSVHVSGRRTGRVKRLALRRGRILRVAGPRPQRAGYILPGLGDAGDRLFGRAEEAAGSAETRSAPREGALANLSCGCRQLNHSRGQSRC